MTIVFAIPLIIGIAALVSWMAASAFASTAASGDRWDPEGRFGPRGRYVIACAFGFGLAGISALYAGWPSWSSLVAGVVGAICLVALSAWVGPRSVP